MVEDSATVIMAPNLDHLKKGGRITPAVALLGNFIKNSAGNEIKL